MLWCRYQVDNHSCVTILVEFLRIYSQTTRTIPLKNMPIINIGKVISEKIIALAGHVAIVSGLKINCQAFNQR